MAMDEQEKLGIVVDNGSMFCRAGMTGDDSPKCTVSSVVGTPREQCVNRKKVNCNVPEEELGNLHFSYPMERGIITNWDDIETLWKHVIFDQLHVVVDEVPVLLTDSPLNPKCQREKMAEVMFESFSVPAIHIVNQALLCAYANGRINCYVLYTGDGVTCTYPVHEGYSIPTGVQRSELTGRDLTNFFNKALRTKGYSFTTTNEVEIVRKMKEALCYNAFDYPSELSVAERCSTQNKTYELPDGNVISVGKERFMVPEALFCPSLINSNEKGIHHLIHESIENCDIDVRSDFYETVTICGGNTMIPGFTKRLKKELSLRAPKNVRILAVPERTFCPWIGGSILGSMSNTVWTLKQDYDEHGPCIVHRNSF